MYKTNYTLVLISLIFLSLGDAKAQSLQDSVFSILEGYWKGAKIKNNAYQEIEIIAFLKKYNFLE